MGKSDRKFSQDDDNDISDSDGGNDSDFSPKIKETEKDKSKKYINHDVFRGKAESVKKNCNQLKVKIKNRNKKTIGNNIKSRTPPQTTAPRRKTQNNLILTGKTSNFNKHLKAQYFHHSQSNVIPIHNQNEPNPRIISLQKKVNEMLKVHSKPLPDNFRRIGSTFVIDRSYQPPIGVLLTMLMKAAIYEIPTRTTSVSILMGIEIFWVLPD